MKLFLVIALISLLTSGVYSAETLTVSQEGSELDKCAVLVFKCAGSVNAADGDGVTHTWKFLTDGGQTFSAINDTDFYKTTPSVVTGSVVTSYLFIKPGKFSANDSVKISCGSTWTGTTANNSSSDGVLSAALSISGTTACDATAFASQNSDFSEIKFTTTAPVSTDAITYIQNTGATLVTSGAALTTLADGDIYYVKYAPANSSTNQALFIYTHVATQKFTVTASTNTDNCKFITPVFKFPKDTNYDNDKSTLTVSVTTAANGATPASPDNIFSTKSVVSTDVSASVIINSGTFGGSNSNGVITLTLTQIKSDNTVIQTNQIVYSVPATTEAAACTLTSNTVSITYSADCTAQNIESTVAVDFATLDGTSLGNGAVSNVQQVQAVSALLAGQVIVKISKTTPAEERFFKLDGTTQPGCVVTAKTAGTKACEVSTFTCERKNPPTSSAVTYTWTLYDVGTSAPVSTSTFDPNATTNAVQDPATNISTLTIPAAKLTGANAYKVQCLSNLAGNSEANQKETDYTPTTDTCSTTPNNPAGDDDDNSQILSALVLVLLALLL